ncbi:MAG: hypothetical protein AMK71_01160 [Nitrospira bacterium SG8_35_4]|nr:MAG: hypothetical protein AMK71_01160 [Nitrospira bacterium SG8_35_4]
MQKRYEIIDKIIAAEIYLLILFMFVTKGEGIRNVLFFSSFFLWLVTLKHRPNRALLLKPVPALFFIFCGTILASALFSIEPLYSLKSLLKDPLKSVIMVCMIATVLSDEKRLRICAYLSGVILVFLLSQGYYSYWAYDLPLMKPITLLRHSWHARFAMDLNTLLPFTALLFFMSKRTVVRIALGALLITSTAAVLLSTSRGGMAALFTTAGVWIFLASKQKNVNWKLILSGVTVTGMVLALVLISSSHIKQRLTDFSTDFATLHERTDIWGPLVSASLLRPVIGWGYGDDIFSDDRPFQATKYKEAPVHIKSAFRNPHNSFLKILFHQGLLGVISYVILLGVVIKSFLQRACSFSGLKSLMLIACSSIMFGTYIVNSIVENPHLTDLALIVGIGCAAMYANSEDSDH